LVKKTENDCESAKNGQSSHDKSGIPDSFPTNNRKVGQDNTMNIKSFPTFPTSPDQKTIGVESNSNKSPATEGVSTEKTRAVNLHPVAVCLLLSVAKKIQSSNEEIFHELLKLETMSPIEQVKTWARYAMENGIDPHQIIYPFIKSPGKGNDCMTCSNLDMTSTKQPDTSRKLYQWRCKKNHQILEAYYLRERVLVSPVECLDYNRQGAG
jgi:hypothetical protein